MNLQFILQETMSKNLRGQQKNFYRTDKSVEKCEIKPENRLKKMDRIDNRGLSSDMHRSFKQPVYQEGENITATKIFALSLQYGDQTYSLSFACRPKYSDYEGLYYQTGKSYFLVLSNYTDLKFRAECLLRIK